MTRKVRSHPALPALLSCLIGSRRSESCVAPKAMTDAIRVPPLPPPDEIARQAKSRQGASEGAQHVCPLSHVPRPIVARMLFR